MTRGDRGSDERRKLLEADALSLLYTLAAIAGVSVERFKPETAGLPAVLDVLEAVQERVYEADTLPVKSPSGHYRVTEVPDDFSPPRRKR